MAAYSTFSSTSTAVADRLPVASLVTDSAYRDKFLMIKITAIQDKNHLDLVLFGSGNVNKYDAPSEDMAPIRTNKGKEALSDGKQRQFHKNKPQKDSNTLPGVQKIKASLRQTRRLLAKVRSGDFFWSYSI